MKFYKYKQVQRMTFFGYDDLLYLKTPSVSKKSPLGTVATDTKIFRFDINRLQHIQLSQNAKMVLESVYVPNITTRLAPATVRMPGLNTDSHDSQRNGFNETLIYTSDVVGVNFQNTAPEILYNFSIDQMFLKNGYVEFQVTYPNVLIIASNATLYKFFISFVIYDVDEQDLLLKDTPEVDFKNFAAHFNINNGRIPK